MACSLLNMTVNLLLLLPTITCPMQCLQWLPRYFLCFNQYYEIVSNAVSFVFWNIHDVNVYVVSGGYQYGVCLSNSWTSWSRRYLKTSTRVTSNQQVTTFTYEICWSWLQEYKIIVKLTYFGPEFETECDVSTCFYRSKYCIPFQTLLQSKLILLHLLTLVQLSSTNHHRLIAVSEYYC